MEPVGTVAELWRYPVKSMLGERCEALWIGSRGVAGDRLFAVRDSAGKFGSGKNTRRFRKIEGLFRYQASYRGDIPQIELPSGEVVGGDESSIHQVLSEALGYEVVLAQESEISHLDAGPVHLVTSCSLEWLRAAMPGARIDSRRFRPNLVIGLPGAGPIEQSWIGKRLRVGEEAEMVVSAPTERCGMVAFAQGDLPKEPGILRHITQRADLRFGIYAKTLVPGIIRLNDPVVLENQQPAPIGLP